MIKFEEVRTSYDVMALRLILILAASFAQPVW